MSFFFNMTDKTIKKMINQLGIDFCHLLILELDQTLNESTHKREIMLSALAKDKTNYHYGMDLFYIIGN